MDILVEYFVFGCWLHICILKAGSWLNTIMSCISLFLANKVFDKSPHIVDFPTISFLLSIIFYNFKNPYY